MSVTETTRLGLTQWSAGTDPFNRSQLNQSLANIEGKASVFLQGTVRPTAAPAYLGTFFFNTGASKALSYCDGDTWYDVVAGDGNFGSPAALAIGSAAADGVLTTASRADHVHEMPSFATAVSIGISNSAGSGTTVARANHVHQIGAGAINDSAMFAPGILGSASLEDGSVTNLKLADNAVTTNKIASGAVINSKLGTDIDTSKITTGVFADARIPALATSKITSGTFDIARIPTGTAGTQVALGNHTHAYSPTGHVHDDRYYTEAEVNSLLAGKSATSHGHAYLPTSGGTISGSLTVTGSMGVGADLSNSGAPGTGNSGLNHWVHGGGGVFWILTSSIETKTDVEDAPEDIVDKLERLRPRTFKTVWEADEGKTLLGLVAEEVYEVMPEITTGKDPKTGRVDSYGPTGLIVPLLMAYQRLSNEQKQLKRQLAALGS